MPPKFPTDRQEKRAVLLNAVEEVRDVLEAGAHEAELLGTLPKATVDALYESGLLWLKLPAELGGAEADLVTQLEVLEAVSNIDTSAGWCTMIGASACSFPGAFLSEEALSKVYADGRPPRAAGVFMPGGTANPVEGGYRVTGRWAFASGIRHAQWVSACAKVQRDDGSESQTIFAIMPASAVTIHDNWHVAGLRGTGSNDFSVSDLFVPVEFTYDRAHAKPRRGGLLYRLHFVGYVSNEHAAFALGAARHALDEIVGVAQAKVRGFGPMPSSMISRGAFQRDIGQCDLKLRAARALTYQVFEDAWAAMCRDGALKDSDYARMRSAATYATEVSLEVATVAFRYGGANALFEGHILQRCFRDINAAAQHLMVSDASYENHGQFVLGLPDADLLA